MTSVDERNYLTQDEVKQVQLHMLDMFDAFCKENNLTYWLAFGTLIGAVRHEGYIPWDDDLDVMMPFSSYRRFEELACTEYGREFFGKDNVRVGSMNVSNDIPYHNTFIKLYDDRTRAKTSLLACKREGFQEAVFIDVFPIFGWDGTAEHIEKRKQADEIYRHLRYASEIFGSVISEGKKALLRKIIGYIPSRIHGYKYYLKEFDKIRNTFPDALDREIWLFFEDGSAPIPMGKNETTVTVQFEGRLVPAPTHYDILLRNIYGDYMQLPPEEERIPSHAQNFYWVNASEETENTTCAESAVNANDGTTAQGKK